MNQFLSLLATLVIGIVLGAILSRVKTESPPPATNWTCSMHPQIRQPKSGKCPICAMDLIPVASSRFSHIADVSGYSMTPGAATRARIATSTITRGNPEVSVQLFGKIAYDETRTRTVAARFPARIERLFVDYTGIRVKEGDHLAALYSPELLAAQSELLSAREAERPDRAEIAREKLRRWGLTTADIEGIEASGTPSEEFVIHSPAGGIVIHLGTEEGRYVQTGTPLFRVGSTEVLWVLLDAYESDLAWLRYGQEITFKAEALPGRTFSARISFLSPELNPATQTVPVRISIENPDGLLRPGMFVRAEVRARAAEGGLVHDPNLSGKWISPMHPEIVRDGPGQCDVCGMDLVPAESLGYQHASMDAQAPLLLPATAVLHTGKRSVVYLAEPDSSGKEVRYSGREVELGPRAGAFYLLVSGLVEGDEVVTEGAFKIDSALQILARPSMMNPPAETKIQVQSQERESEPEPSSGPETVLENRFRLALEPFLQSYFVVQEGLASDALGPAQEAASPLIHVLHQIPGTDGPAEWLTTGNLIVDAAQEILSATDLPSARIGFEELSLAFLQLAKAHQLAPSEGAQLVLCPMAFADRGARWLQRPGPVNNPYHGAKMLRCGEVEDTLAPRESESAVPPAVHPNVH